AVSTGCNFNPVVPFAGGGDASPPEDAEPADAVIGADVEDSGAGDRGGTGDDAGGDHDVELTDTGTISDGGVPDDAGDAKVSVDAEPADAEPDGGIDAGADVGIADAGTPFTAY